MWGDDSMRDGHHPDKSEPASRRNRSASASEVDDGRLSDDVVRPIVSACQNGERSSQAQLYELFHRQIYRLMVRMVGVDMAADLTQQVFLQVYRKIGQFSGRGHFEGWLYRLAVNEAYQYLRRKRKDRQTALVYEPLDSSARVTTKTERKDLMEQALARLDPELRSICLLREIEELSYREIAEILDIPEGTVGSRLNRARRELRDHLVNLGWEP